MHYVIAAAGTGGHVLPALAIAEQAVRDGHQVSWLGTHHGIESTLVKDLPLYTLPARGVRGKGRLQAMLGLCALALGGLKSLWLLCRLRPDVVLVMGGYIALPVGLAAWLMQIPLVVHEQNTIAGSANRLLARFASRILLGLPGAFDGSVYQDRCDVVGNPLRTSIMKVAREQKPKHTGSLRCLVLGGSLGAAFLNDQIIAWLQALPIEDRPEIWHQCGRQHVHAMQAAYQRAGIEARIDGFIDTMAQAYNWADCVIARAGAMSVAELSYLALPAFLVPFPYAIDDHQASNAAWLCAHYERSQWCPQADLSADALTHWLKAQSTVGVRQSSSAVDATARILTILEALGSR